MPTHYLEVVTNDVDATCAFYESVHGLSFAAAPDADLGMARVATTSDGNQVGVRKPLAEHESPTVRVYTCVADINAAAVAAEKAGAIIAYPPTKQGEHGTFSIVILGGVQLGLWQP